VFISRHKKTPVGGVQKVKSGEWLFWVDEWLGFVAGLESGL